MEWFDCHAEIGRRTAPGWVQAPNAAALAALYGEIGIQRALVVHTAMREIHPENGNARVLEETATFPQFTPTWAIMPPQTEELGDVATFLAQARAAGVRALWAFATGYPINAITLGPLLEEMAAHNIPLFVKAGTTDWPGLTALLTEMPQLRVVAVTTHCWGEDRYFRPLIERFPHLYLATSMLMTEGGLKAFCDRYGARQLLFGTSFPDCQPGGSLFALLRAGLRDDDLAAIAGGNLQRLLEEVRL